MIAGPFARLPARDRSRRKLPPRCSRSLVSGLLQTQPQWGTCRSAVVERERALEKAHFGARSRVLHPQPRGPTYFLSTF